MKRRRDTRRRSDTSRLVRLNLPTIALLEKLRRATRLSYGGYDRLVRELATRELLRRGLIDGDERDDRGIGGLGLPTLPKIGPAPSPASARAGALPIARSEAGGGDPRHGEGSR